jgi:hypothetical protein
VVAPGFVDTDMTAAGLNAITAGIGWLAVSSVSGTFALNTRTHLS